MFDRRGCCRCFIAKEERQNDEKLIVWMSITLLSSIIRLGVFYEFFAPLSNHFKTSPLSIMDHLFLESKLLLPSFHSIDLVRVIKRYIKFWLNTFWEFYPFSNVYSTPIIKLSCAHSLCKQTHRRQVRDIFSSK